jgi:hypothetical protein
LVIVQNNKQCTVQRIEIIVHLLVIVQNNKQCTVQRIEIIKTFRHRDM